MINYEGFYAVVVICLVILAAIVCCLGIRIFRRAALKNAAHLQQQQNGHRAMTDEWQPLDAVSDTIVGPIDEESRHELERVLAWQSKYPPQIDDYMDVANDPTVRERGAAAWTFVENERMEDTDEDSNAAVMDRTTLVFCHGQGCALANLPIPMQEFAYWEVKVLQLHEQDRLAVGLATKPYPAWRLPGWHRHSVAYHSQTGAVHASDPFLGRPYGPPFKEGDVIGVGYLANSSTLFFTRNGKNLGKASIGFKFPVYPAVGANGPCQISVNFGQQDFLFAPANLREAGLAPKQGTLPPPPAYGDVRNTVMLFGSASDEANNSSHLDYSQQHTSINIPPPSTMSATTTTTAPQQQQQQQQQQHPVPPPPDYT